MHSQPTRGEGAAAGVPHDALNHDAPGADIDQYRVAYYSLLGDLLGAPPDNEALARLSELDDDNSPFGQTIATLAGAATVADADPVAVEFHNLFIGLGQGELVPYASYYLTGFLHERPLAALRRDMSALGLARADKVYEPEDGMASLCEIMAGLISGAFGTPADLETQRAFFDRHLGPWAFEFVTDLEHAKSGNFYRAVGAFGHAFLELEQQAFAFAGTTTEGRFGT